ncbi:beta-lactamase/transpeptidase-like protein [Bombardia bombarda]|uniref:Beta-lactamase/transpeptidase-like protein n=1 Tax=Bombardia bombarda TaxID=252184 RepID=A0AA39X8L5_9PEZI|nr:beta-lactamase/transpeptidase-like protein [Bombardia bombarda]
MDAPVPLDDLLKLVGPTIDHILGQYGIDKASIGVLKGGQTRFISHGYDKNSHTAEETPYLISSMTKAFTSLSIFIMINDPKHNISLETHIGDVWEHFDHSNKSVDVEIKNITIGELLDMRSHFQRCTNLWESPNGDIPWKTVDPILSLFSHLPPSIKNIIGFSKTAFNYTHAYSNECYALAAAIIEKKSGTSWFTFVRENILEPLAMNNTHSELPLDTPAASNMVGCDIALPHSNLVQDTLQRLQAYTNRKDPSINVIMDFLKSDDHFIPPESVLVEPSTACKTSNPIGAAAGILSTTADLLKFYTKLIEVYRRLKAGAEIVRIGTRRNKTQRLENGMLEMLRYIQSKPKPYVYAGGLSRVLVPWDPNQTEPQPRWPGADGDNQSRLEFTIREALADKGISDTELRQRANLAWQFFMEDQSGDDIELDSELALYHGGNMVGATSFVFMVPGREFAVVVLCNARGYFLDGANLSCMLLADCLFRTGDAGEYILNRCRRTRLMARHIAAAYLYHLTRYEDTLATKFPTLADPATFAGCIGRYQLCDGIYVTVSAGKYKGENCLQLQMYDLEFRYPLRVRKDNKQSEAAVVMTMAMPMEELVVTGVGGKNRLTIEDWTVSFRQRDAMTGTFSIMGWNFAGRAVVRGHEADGEFRFGRVDV